MENQKPQTWLGLRTFPALIGAAGVVAIGAFFWWQSTARSAKHLAPRTTAVSCNAVSTISNAVIDEAHSKATKNVTITYTLRNTVNTGLNCFTLAMINDSSGTQVGTWRRSFLHGAPGTYHEQQDLGTIPYYPGETLTLTIIAAEGNTEFVD